jgi:ABC-type glycerol-3-phosphate transport system substrate-binding protein
VSLPEISKDVFADTKNAEAAIKFAQWAQGAEYDQVVAAYAKCHSDPNLDDTFIRTLG